MALGQQTPGSRPGSGTCHDFDLRGSPIGTELCKGTATGAVEFCVRIRNQDSGFSHPSSSRLSPYDDPGHRSALCLALETMSMTGPRFSRIRGHLGLKALILRSQYFEVSVFSV